MVWFGEMLPEGAFERAFTAASSSQVFIVAGTSGVVEPAASLARVAREAGANVIEINPEDTPLTDVADVALRGPSGQLLPALLETS